MCPSTSPWTSGASWKSSLDNVGYDLVEVYRRLKAARPPRHLVKRCKRAVKLLEHDAIRAPQIVAGAEWVMFLFQHQAAWCAIHIYSDGYSADWDRGLFDGFVSAARHAGFSACRAAARRFSSRVIDNERRALWKRWEETGEKRPRMKQHAGAAGRKSPRPSTGRSPRVALETLRSGLHAQTATSPSGEYHQPKLNQASGGQ